MEEELISFETAKLAKKKGYASSVSNSIYNESGKLLNPIKQMDKIKEFEYLTDYFEHVKSFPNAITQSLLQKWLREVHNLHIYIDTTPTFSALESHKSKYKSLVKVPFQPFKWTTGKYYLGNTYEEALEQALLQSLNLIK